MSISKVPRDPETFELLRLYGENSAGEGVSASLDSDDRLNDFLNRARISLEQSVASPSRVHGLRVQALFRATLIALGQFRRLNDEDTGHPYYEDREGRAAPPDFRAVDNTGRSLLIEVKSVKLNDPLKPFRLRRADVEAWRRWGQLDGTPVALAFWWQVPGLWTLIPLDRLRSNGAKEEIDLLDAMAANEMSRFGDSMLATRPPLSLRLNVKQTEKRKIDTTTNEHSVLITELGLRSRNQIIRDRLEQKIAWWILRYGKWPVTEEPRINSQGGLEAIDLVAQPEEELPADQDFASVGMLSSLYAVLFEEATASPAGRVEGLDHTPKPNELSDLIPADFWDAPDRVLRLWRFNLEPVDPSSVTRPPRSA